MTDNNGSPILEPPTVPQSMEEVKSLYPSACWEVGVDLDGIAVRPTLRDVPHLLAVSEYGGSGLTLFTRINAEDKRLRGFETVVIDGGSDWSEVDRKTVRNLIIVPSHDTARVVETLDHLAGVVRERVYVAAQRKRTAVTDAEVFDFHPILVVVDSWSHLAEMLTHTLERDHVVDNIDALLRLGRDVKVHVMVTTNRVSGTVNTHIPSRWVVNLPYVVNLGPITDSALNTFVPDELQETAQEISAEIMSGRGDWTRVVGRGFVVDRDRWSVTPIRAHTVDRSVWRDATRGVPALYPALISDASDTDNEGETMSDNTNTNTNNTNNEGDTMSDNTTTTTATATSKVEPTEVVEDTATDAFHSSYVPITPLGEQRPRWTQVIKHPLVVGAVAVAIASTVSGIVGWYRGVDHAQFHQTMYEWGVVDGRIRALDEQERIKQEVESRRGDRVDVLDPPLSGQSVKERLRRVAEVETNRIAVERDGYLVIPARTPLPKNVVVFGEVVSGVNACIRVGGQLLLSDPVQCDTDIRVKYVI